jgi:molecular chaperone GrpE
MMKKERSRDPATENSVAAEAEPNVPSPGAEEPRAANLSVSPEGLTELKAQAATAKENWEQFIRMAADFENYRKRAAREKADAVRFANESLLQKLVPVLDNFDMAAAAASGAQGDAPQSLQEGVNMILSQLRTVLTEAGLEEIDATGKTFDPNFHEAVAQQETTDVPEGQVVQQLRKGYKLRDRLLRPATVIVAKQPALAP